MIMVARAAGIVKHAPDPEQAALDGTLKLGDADAIRKLPEDKIKQSVEAVKSSKSRTATRLVHPPNAQAPTRATPAADKPRASGAAAGSPTPKAVGGGELQVQLCQRFVHQVRHALGDG